jgi:UDP-4-amino-4,6-dideoxy-N-acetyl-beta-L-altrosamine transaminase
MRKPIPYGRQHIDEKDIEAVVSTLKSDFLTTGPKVKEFEDKFAEYVGAKYAVAVSNGTAALHLSCLALGLKPGQKVLTTPITFAASSNCVLYCGADDEFCDIDRDTYLIDIEAVEAKLAEHPKGTYAGIIPVDFTGLPVNTEALRKLADEHDLWIIEDACHAPGAYYIDSKGQKISAGGGTYSDLTCFSFHPVQHLASGEGGRVTTNDEDLYKSIRQLRTHGIRNTNMDENHGGWYHEMHDLGYNYRLPDINCALGIEQLAKADKGLSRRLEIAHRYDLELSKIPEITIQKQPENSQNAYHLYVIEVPDRKNFYDYLREKQILAQVHYIPTHLHPFYKKRGWGKGDMPQSEDYYEHCISIPMFPSLSDEEQGYVIECIQNYFNA